MFHHSGKVHSRTDLLYDYHNHLHAEEANDEGATDAQFWRAHSTQILDKIAENKQVKAGAASEGVLPSRC